MVWWGRRKTDPPTVKPPSYADNNPEPQQPPALLGGQNVVNFPDKRLSDLNRKAVHALLDKLLDEIGENEYLVMGIEESE